MSYTVYMHVNRENGKRYIGITKRDAAQRWCNGNAYRRNRHFAAAIKKVGWDGFQHEIVSQGLSKEEAYEQEIALIQKYKSNDRRFGYNLTSGGDPGSGRIWTQEERDKQSARRKGCHVGESTKRKLSMIMKNRPQEMKMAFASAQRGKIPWNKGLCGKDNPCYGQKRTAEQRMHISVSLKGKPKSEEHRRKLSDLNRGRTMSEDARKKLSERNAGHKHPQAKQVENITTGETFECLKYAAQKYGVSISAISNCCRGKVRKSAGQEWRFV